VMVVMVSVEQLEVVEEIEEVLKPLTKRQGIVVVWNLQTHCG